MKRKHTHVAPYSEETKRICLSLLHSGKHKVMTLTKVKGCPDASTLYRWLREETIPVEDRHVPLKRGPRPIFSIEELKIIAEFVLQQMLTQYKTNTKIIQDF